MKLIIAIVSNDDKFKVNDKLIEEGYSVTRLSSKGGFLRKENATLLIATPDEKVEKAIKIIKAMCKTRKSIVVPNAIGLEYGFLTTTKPVEINVGGARVFIINVEKEFKI